MSLRFAVTFGDGIDEKMVLASPVLHRWMEKVDINWEVTKVEIVSVDYWGGHVGFIELDVDYVICGNSHNERIILDGGSVAVVPLVTCSDDDRLYTILVEQPRIAVGKLIYEYPAGMNDDSVDFKDVAIRELEEECGVVVKDEDLVDITDMFLTGGPFLLFPETYDDSVHVYSVRLTMTRTELDAIEGRNCGVDEEEQIVVRVVPFDIVNFISSDAQTVAITYATESLLSKGLI